MLSQASEGAQAEAWAPHSHHHGKETKFLAALGLQLDPCGPDIRHSQCWIGAGGGVGKDKGAERILGRAYGHELPRTRVPGDRTDGPRPLCPGVTPPQL